MQGPLNLPNKLLGGNDAKAELVSIASNCYLLDQSLCFPTFFVRNTLT